MTLPDESPAPMKLAEALRLVAQNPAAGASDTLQVALACGFTPLHLQTFLAAHLRTLYPQHRIDIVAGTFDDIPGTLRSFAADRYDAIVLVVEWADIDARLGLRRLGGWSPRHSVHIVQHAQTWLAQLRLLVEQAAETSPIIVVLPTLPLPPLFHHAGWQSGSDELRLKELLFSFAAAIGRHPRVRVISDRAVDAVSPVSERLSVKSTWMSGFPYRNQHASRLAELVARGIRHRLPKKGLITDLDGTLWSGIVGDDGPDKVSWDLDGQSQAHGLYQQFLGALAEEGVLVGVASKNDAAIVEETFSRADILLAKERVFPFVVGWGSKAEGVSQILAAWNVNADSVIFVDDSPMEIAEVKAAHPSMECVLFPRQDPDAAYDMIVRLREEFGRGAVSAEDAMRLESLRGSAAIRAAASDSDGYAESLLQQANPEVTIDFGKDPRHGRPFELVNKTNQFNLNGRRFTERGWSEYLDDPHTFLMTVGYKDDFGALGQIAVVAGRVDQASVRIDVWVMSCRAFARRIEHQCLKIVFQKLAADSISFEYQATPRNGPLATFLETVLPEAPASTSTAVLTKTRFEAVCPALFHRVIVKGELGNERYAGAAR
jgi:FkbH-like protein